METLHKVYCNDSDNSDGTIVDVNINHGFITFNFNGREIRMKVVEIKKIIQISEL